MEEIVVSQRFSIYKALNGLLPGRRGRGWWFDLRPSVLPSDEEGPPAPPGDAGAWGSRAFWLFDRGLRHRPFVDASELWSAAARMARAALAAQGDEPQALLTLGAHEVWGAMVLAQSMEPAINKLSAALGEANQLTPRQARVGAFFLGKAHQVEGRARDADHWFRRALPAALRWAYPAMRRWMWSLP